MAMDSMDSMHSHTPPPAARRSVRAAWVATAMTVLIVAFFLLREHWGHVAGYWPYLLLLACPVMHLMHGHGHHKHRAGRDPASRSTDQAG